jgi:T4-like virus tail tube protein gp19
MAFKVDELISSIQSKGVLKTSKYEVSILGPYTLEDSNIRCVRASIPGIQLTTNDFKLYGAMPALKLPTSRQYDNINLTFLAKSDSSDRYFFENWMNDISNFSSNTLAYYDDVASTIKVTVYDETSSSQYTVDVLKAIPINLNTVNLSWEDSNKLLELEVEFSFQEIQIRSNSNLSTQIMP